MVRALPWLLVAAVAITVPLLAGDNYALRLATTAALYVALASGWNILGGFAGYPSFATAAFFGLGAYGAAVLESRYGVPRAVAWGCGGLLAAALALMIGPAILRLRGHYFAIASLVLAAVLRELVNAATETTGGGMGLTLPALRLGVEDQARLHFAAMAAVAAAAVGVAWAVRRARLGWALRCIEQNEDAAVVLGVDTLRAKTFAFALSAVFAGLAGGIYASWISYIDPTDVFEDLLSVKPIVMTLLGGVGTIAGPVLGAIVFLAVEEVVWRNFLTFHAGMLGLVVVLLLVFLPNGLGSLHPFLRARIWLRTRLGRPVAVGS